MSAQGHPEGDLRSAPHKAAPARMRSARLGAAAALALLCWGAVAAPDSDAAERDRIAADRRAVQARFEVAQRDCETRFIVNQCLEQARHARREALAPLQRQSDLLDDARRRARAAERLRAIRARESAAAAKPALLPASAALPAAASDRPPVQRAVRAAPAASAAVQAAQHRAAQQQQRLHDAQIHQDAVQARNAKQDARRPPAASLPVPVPPAAVR